MGSINRPKSVVIVAAEPKGPGYPTGTVDLKVEDGRISLTPGEARQLADLLRSAADEAETERPPRQVSLA